MRGTFIVLEGPDGSGTTLHSAFLADRIRAEGGDVLVTAEPTESPIGANIRALLHGSGMPAPDATQLLFCADRAEHVATVILPALERGTTVISDRYALSTIVYGTALGLDEAWLRAVNSRFPKPDITIITLPPFAVCMERMSRRDARDQYERQEFQQKVHALYASLKEPQCFSVDTSQSKEATAEVVWNLVRPLLTRP
ncbi:MAG: dTMP kinase [Candidatus Peribacteraceae bacterium]|nr:dTMP kinase [Candidatus Peribacteraceae bacterium]